MMMVYKVYCKNYEQRKGEFIGVLIERRNEFRGKTPIESGLRWAKFAFKEKVKDHKGIFVVPIEVNLENDSSIPMTRSRSGN